MSNVFDLELIKREAKDELKELSRGKKRLKKNRNKEFEGIEDDDYYDRYYKRWSNEEDDRLIELYNENLLTIKGIAKEMGRTRGSIENRITELRRERGRELKRTKKQEVLGIEGC